MAVITISRQAGAPGEELAEATANRLGYLLVRRVDLAHLAGAACPTRARMADSPELCERAPGFWERQRIQRQLGAAALRSTVLELAVQDRVVIVGLGGGQILAGCGHALRVQVAAPPQVRLACLMAAGDEDRPPPLTAEQARTLMHQRDRESAAYVRYLFGSGFNLVHPAAIPVNRLGAERVDWRGRRRPLCAHHSPGSRISSRRSSNVS